MHQLLAMLDGYAPGTRVGRFEIVRPLARGGMAELYLAQIGESGFERQVVIKRIAPHLETEDFLEMFLDEARLVSRLDHPNIVQVHDVGVDARGWYIAMEFVHGGNLRELLDELRERGERFPIDIAIAIVKGILLALHAAHEARDRNGERLGLVHRDVSPANVLVGFNGNVKLIDFGIAKAHERRAHTSTGVVKGKYAYMSPEQCRGGTVDRRTDIFATGALLFELITGRRLFEAESDYLLMQQLVGCEVRPARSLRPETPHELEGIIDQALARDPDRRFATAKAMYRALDQFADAKGLSASQFEISDLVHRLLAADRPRSWAEGSDPDGTMLREESTLPLRPPRMKTRLGIGTHQPLVTLPDVEGEYAALAPRGRRG